MKELEKEELMRIEGGQVWDLVDFILGCVDESISSLILKGGAINGYYRDQAGIPVTWSGHGY